MHIDRMIEIATLVQNILICNRLNAILMQIFCIDDFKISL